MPTCLLGLAKQRASLGAVDHAERDAAEANAHSFKPRTTKDLKKKKKKPPPKEKVEEKVEEKPAKTAKLSTLSKFLGRSSAPSPPAPLAVESHP